MSRFGSRLTNSRSNSGEPGLLSAVFPDLFMRLHTGHGRVCSIRFRPASQRARNLKKKSKKNLPEVGSWAFSTQHFINFFMDNNKNGCVGHGSFSLFAMFTLRHYDLYRLSKFFPPFTSFFFFLPSAPRCFSLLFNSLYVNISGLTPLAVSVPLPMFTNVPGASILTVTHISYY